MVRDTAWSPGPMLTRHAAAPLGLRAGRRVESTYEGGCPTGGIRRRVMAGSYTRPRGGAGNGSRGCRCLIAGRAGLGALSGRFC